VISFSDLLDALWRLVLALGLSALIGVERDLAGKPAGIRTHMLVGFGAALFMIVAEFSGMDTSRVMAGIITGVGFLGAGTIIRERGAVLGLTTAASIWAVAGIGIAVAARLWLIAVIATAGVFLVLWGLGYVEKLIARAWERRRGGKS
jgi:putative Mg2+ transporter-C (MgtC) family protein